MIGEISKYLTKNNVYMQKFFYQLPGISKALFGADTRLLPSANELFELELASLEYRLLKSDELIKRSAFFEMVNGVSTNHFQLCSYSNQAHTEERDAKTQAYFMDGRFLTGYATYGLFPYREIKNDYNHKDCCAKEKLQD